MPNIGITSEGNQQAGENYTLICAISFIGGLAGDVMISGSWSDNIGNLLQQEDMLPVNENASLMLQFNPLYSSHGRDYFCSASISIPEIAKVRNNTLSERITLQSKYN